MDMHGHPRARGLVILAAGLFSGLCLGAAAQAAPATVAAEDLDALIQAGQGILIVNLSSPDPHCVPCVSANAKFSILALGSNTARFVQVVWEPWRQVPPAVHKLLSRYSLPASFPQRLAFQDGKLIDKVIGEPPMPAQPRTFPQTGKVEVVEPLDAPRRLAQTPGVSVWMLSSFEPDCAFCLRANPGFEELAGSVPAGRAVKFLRVMYRPWTSAGVDPFGGSLKVAGLPLYLVFKDGQVVRRHEGFDSVEVLRRNLLEGLP